MTDSYIKHLSWVVKELTTEIAIYNSVIRAIEEIQDLWRSGVLTDQEYVEISDRIGW